MRYLPYWRDALKGSDKRQRMLLFHDIWYDLCSHNSDEYELIHWQQL